MSCFHVIVSVSLFFSTAVLESSHSFSDTLIQASKENRTVLAIFLAPDGCPWSSLLSQEVVHHPDFLKKIEGETLTCLLSSEEKELQAHYQLSEYPILLLLDPRGKEFARFGYLPITPEHYGEKIHQLIEDFEKICFILDHPGLPFDEEQWKQLYEKSKQLSATCYREVLLNKGMKKEKGSFFHLERYDAFLQKYKPKHPQIAEFKKKLLQRKEDPTEDLAFEVARLEFQKLKSRARAKEHYAKALIPLFNYLGQKEKKRLKSQWKAEWLIGEYLASQKKDINAQQYMESAFRGAPESFKPALAERLKWIQSQRS